MYNKANYSKNEANKTINFSPDDVANTDTSIELPTSHVIPGGLYGIKLDDKTIDSINEGDNKRLPSNVTMGALKDIINRGTFNGRSFESICCELIALHDRKNKDYGDSFTKTMDMFGIIALCIRLNDKLSRLISVVKNGKCEVQDESIDDTLMDLAAYAIMGLEYLYNRLDLRNE